MASKIGKAIGLGGSMDGMDDESDVAMDSEVPQKPKGESPEVMAMRVFMRSDDPVKKAAALKSFIKACQVSDEPDDDDLY